MVENDSAIRDMAASVLAASGLEVEQAGDGAEALRQALRAPPDVIVTDVKMPIMDGWQFLEECRKVAVCAAIPAVVMSAACGSPAQSHDHLHVNAFLAKPFDVDELLAIVERLLVTPTAMLVQAHSRWEDTPSLR